MPRFSLGCEYVHVKCYVQGSARLKKITAAHNGQFVEHLPSCFIQVFLPRCSLCYVACPLIAFCVNAATHKPCLIEGTVHDYSACLSFGNRC